MPALNAIHCARYFLGFDEPETQVTRHERELLARHVATKRRAAEIGVFEGSTTRFLAEQMDRDGELYAIDLFFAADLVSVGANSLLGRKYEIRAVQEFMPLRPLVTMRLA